MSTDAARDAAHLDAADPGLSAALDALRQQVADVTGDWMGPDALASAARPLADAADEVTGRLSALAAPLTVSAARVLAEILRAVRDNNYVARAGTDGQAALVGTALRLVHGETGLTVPPDADMRACRLHVRGPLGENWFWPVAELIPDRLAGRLDIAGRLDADR